MPRYSEFSTTSLATTGMFFTTGFYTDYLYKGPNSNNPLITNQYLTIYDGYTDGAFAFTLSFVVFYNLLTNNQQIDEKMFAKQFFAIMATLFLAGLLAYELQISAVGLTMLPASLLITTIDLFYCNYIEPIIQQQNFALTINPNKCAII